MNEVDPKALSQRLGKFLAHGDYRLEKMLMGFGDQQADYIRILPLLFQVNHPMLPGFIEPGVPAGLPGYHPSRVALQIARGICKSFQYTSKAHLRFDIEGLYLMGSTGSIGQAAGSDLDCWLVIRSDLEAGARRQLSKKCHLLSHWFREKGIELNCYLVATDDFMQRRLPGLLLDEFYRTAVWLAGRKPLWWLVDDEQPHQPQVQRWLKERHLDAAEWLDLGPVTPLAAEEFLQAALAQLLKAMTSPFKSVIKLTLLEVYAVAYPNVLPLSHVYKLRLLKGEPLAQLDPYLLLYDYLAERLTRSPKRIAFLQKSFYLKSGVKLTWQKPKRPGWRWQLMSQLCQEWGMGQGQLQQLDRRQAWSVAEIRRVRAELLVMLNQSYHFLNDFSRLHGITSLDVRRQILTIGRQLYVAFEEKANKITCITQGILPRAQPGELTIYCASQDKWLLFHGLVAAQVVGTREPVYQAPSPAALLLWAIVNGYADSSTLVHLVTDSAWPALEHLRLLQKQLADFWQRHRAEATAQDLLASEETHQLLVIGNLHQDPMAWDRRNNQFQVDSGDDFHAYGAHRANFFADLTVIRITSWGQLTLEYYRGNDAALSLWQKHRKAIANGRLESWFLGGVNRTKVAEKFVALLTDLQHRSTRLKDDEGGFECRRAGDQWLLIHYAEFTRWQRFPDLETALEAFAEQSVGTSSVSLTLEKCSESEQILPSKISHANELIQIACFSWPQQSLSAHAARRKLATSSGAWNMAIRLPSGHCYVQRYGQSEPGLMFAHYHHFFTEQNRLITLETPGCDWWTFYKGQWRGKDLRFQTCKPDLNAALKDLATLRVEMTSQAARQFFQSTESGLPDKLKFNWQGDSYVVVPDQPQTLLALWQAVCYGRHQRADYPLHISSISLKDDGALSMPQALLIKHKLEKWIQTQLQDLVEGD